MLVEHGYVRVQVEDGEEFTFCPSFDRMASLGTPREIVGLFAQLYEPQAAQAARYVLGSLCEQEDPTPLIGALDEDLKPVPGAMPAEGKTGQIEIARYLMRHGCIGNARPGASEGGEYSPGFDASKYIALARVHMGLSAVEAASLSMTEFQSLWAVKFPETAGNRDVPDEDEYEATMAMIRESAGG